MHRSWPCSDGAEKNGEESGMYRRPSVRRLYVDTCSIVEFDAFLRFTEGIAERLEHGELLLCVPRKTVYEILAIIRNPEKSQETKRSAFRALLLLRGLQQRSFLEFFGTTDRIADAVFLDHAINNIRREPICVLTNDHALAHDLLAFNHLSSASCSDMPIESFELCPDGRIRRYE